MEIMPNEVEAGAEQLINAAGIGTVESVGDLLEHGTAVDSRGFARTTALMCASRYGNGAVANLLLDREADANAQCDFEGRTPGVWASEEGHLDILRQLVARGANIHHRTKYGDSCLLLAAMNDRLPVCEYLLSLGADLYVRNNRNETALSHWAYWKVSREAPPAFPNFHRIAIECLFRAGPQQLLLMPYVMRAEPPIPPATKALRRAALMAAWAAGLHPSQVQRRRDECWFRRGPLLTVLAEHAYRPLQLRALAIALAAAELDPSEAVVVQTSRMQDVFRDEGLVRYVVSFL